MACEIGEDDAQNCRVRHRNIFSEGNRLEVLGSEFLFEAQYAQPVPQSEEEIPSIATQLVALDAMMDTHEDLTQGGNVFAAAWGSDVASLLRVSLPFTDMAQINKTLQFAVEDEVPFDLDEMTLGWRILSQDKESSILVGLAPTEEVQGFLSELAVRKMDPKNVLIDAEVLASWSGEQTSAVIDVGHRRTLIVVGTNGTVVTSRVVDIGGWHLTRAIQEALECTWQEAEGVKHGQIVAAIEDAADASAPGPGSYGALPDAARAKVDAVLSALMAEIRATLIASEDNYGVSIEQIRLGGGGSQFGPITSMLERALGVPVYCVVNEDQQPIDAPYLISDGIAAHLTGRISTELIDLRQGDLAYRSGMNGLQSLVTYGTLALAVFTLVAGGWYFWQRSALSGQIDEVEAHKMRYMRRACPGKRYGARQRL